MELPLCLEDYEPELTLTVTDRQELIQNLAQSGPRSIGNFITKHSDDSRSGIAKLMQRLRSRLEEQINRTKVRIEQKFRRREERIRREMQIDMAPVEDGVSTDNDFSRKEQEMSYIDHELDSKLVDILTQDDILDFIINLKEEQAETEMVKSRWARFREAVQFLFRYIISLIRRFISWLKSKFGKHEHKASPVYQKQSNILLRFPSGKKLWDDIDHNLDNALATSPEFKRAIDRDLGEKYGKKLGSHRRVSWQKYFDQDRYANEARQMINHRIKRVIKREQGKLARGIELKKRQVKKMQQLQHDKVHQEVRHREAEARIKQLEKQRAAELKNLKEQSRKKVHRSVKKALVNELEDAGLVLSDENKKLKITSRLIDRFAEIVLSNEIKKLPSRSSYAAHTHGMPFGVYEKKKLQTVSESSRMDIVSSLVNARLAHPKVRHIEDSDIITHSEMRSSISHVVLIFDKSGSMEENNRILAAKKSVLALYKAVKHRNPKNIVDFIAFDSTVHVMDLLQAWHSNPSGFTNTAEALTTANELISDSHADRKFIYLITDGLPEAYTDLNTGKPRAGDLKKSLSVAVKKAKLLKKMVGLRFTIILLEPKETVYTEAAKTIADAAGGTMIVTDPNELATEMLMDYNEV